MAAADRFMLFGLLLVFLAIVIGVVVAVLVG
jgi:hypothetical protein